MNNVCPRQILGYKSGEGLHLCPAAHAERNAIDNAASLGVRVEGLTMYMNCPIPCSECMKSILVSRISKLVCSKISYYDNMSKYLIEHGNIEIRTFCHLDEEGNEY